MHGDARLSGFGVVVVPRAPFRIERAADAPETTLRVWRDEREGMVDVRAVLGGEASELLEVSAGPARDAWWIETAELGCAWPHGLALASDPEGGAFLLLGPREAMLWIDGPIARERAWPIDVLAGEGQRVRAIAETTSGDGRLDLDYVIEGELWWQRRYVIGWGEGRVLVLSAQARASDEEPLRDAIDQVERTLAKRALAS